MSDKHWGLYYSSCGASCKRTALTICTACELNRCSCIQLFAILWTIACQAHQLKGFSRKEYWSTAMPSSRGSSWPRDSTCASCLLHWQAGSLLPAPPGKPHMHWGTVKRTYCQTASVGCRGNKRQFWRLDLSTWMCTDAINSDK